ncbi:hypothetical protein ACMFMG_008036 [Clarireedia jacksonii]
MENMATAVSLSGTGEDPRLPNETNNTTVRPQHRKLHDPSVTFEEYHYYANITRAEEDASANTDIGDTTFFSLIVPPKNLKGAAPVNSAPVPEKEIGEEKTTRHIHDMSDADRLNISDDEWHNASRSMRVATWAAIFYLITTDILGPFGVPLVLSPLTVWIFGIS